MNRIVKIGMDVHSTNYTLCAKEPRYEGGSDVLMEADVGPSYKNVTKFIDKLKKRFGDNMTVTCGYEAGGLGFTLYRQLTKEGIDCVILAPSTMYGPQGKRIKTDKRDAGMIADCLADNTYSPVHVMTPEDEAVRDYVRMREDHQLLLQKVKQEICALLLRYGYKYAGNKWTQAHREWIKGLGLKDIVRETVDEYLETYDRLAEKIARCDVRIEELSGQAEYREKVRKLCCFTGIKTHIALSLVVETGDFDRFKKGSLFAAYLGLVPGEHSSGAKTNRLSITKAGNMHLRKLMIEAANGICKGEVGHKSKALVARQQGNEPPVIEYADRANLRLRRRYYRMIRHGKQRNVAVTAIARELACFVWGMMTGNMAPRQQAITSNKVA